MAQRLIFDRRATLLLPMMIVVKDGWSQPVVLAVVSPSLRVRRVVVAGRVFSILEVLAFGELCHMKVMVRDPGDRLCLLIINCCPKTSHGVFLRQRFPKHHSWRLRTLL